MIPSVRCSNVRRGSNSDDDDSIWSQKFQARSIVIAVYLFEFPASVLFLIQIPPKYVVFTLGEVRPRTKVSRINSKKKLRVLKGTKANVSEFGWLNV